MNEIFNDRLNDLFWMTTLDMLFMFCACHIARWFTMLTARMISDNDDFRAFGFYYVSLGFLGVAKVADFLTETLAWGVLAIFVTSVLNIIHG